MCLVDSMFEVVQRVKQGDTDAVQAIWERYFPRVVRLAGSRLAGQRARMSDEEDVAISVMESFFRAAREGRFPELRDGDGLWRLLASMTYRKVVDQIRRNAARPASGESALEGCDMASLAARDPTPAMVAIVTDEIERLMTVLPEKYHQIALQKLQCMTAPEIARHCGVHLSTVERRLRIVREYWARELGDELAS